MNTINYTAQENENMSVSYKLKSGFPACPKCGNNRQVWVNQITRHMTCHRMVCGSYKIEAQDLLTAN